MYQVGIYVAKTKALVTGQLICNFVFANARSRFSHDAAHMCMLRLNTPANNFSSTARSAKVL